MKMQTVIEKVLLYVKVFVSKAVAYLIPFGKTKFSLVVKMKG